MNKFNCGIYSITAPSGNQYIGSSKTIKKRWSEHKSLLKRNIHTNQALQNSWNKYDGKLEFKQLLVCRIEDLLFYEQLFIDNLKPEYNICTIAGNTLGVKPSQDVREKMSRSQLGRKHSDETRAKISASNTGKKNSPEHIAKMISSKTGHKYGPCSEERKQKISLANKGRKMSEEVKQTLRDAWVIRRMNSVCPIQ
jgi:group I intron endonuclease